jgi:hypothetical protein
VKLAADANALLSVVLRRRAKLILDHSNVGEALTTKETFAAVQEYAPCVAKRQVLALDPVLPAVSALPVTVVGRDVTSVLGACWHGGPLGSANHQGTPLHSQRLRDCGSCNLSLFTLVYSSV